MIIMIIMIIIIIKLFRNVLNIYKKFKLIKLQKKKKKKKKEFGIKVSKESPIKIENSYFNNSFFTRGLFSLNYFVDDSLSSTGNYTILGTTFENIYGIKGSVFDIEGYDYHNFSYNITNCIFKNNYSKYGGVIYSINDDSSKSINFTNCEFINNRSPLGKY